MTSFFKVSLSFVILIVWTIATITSVVIFSMEYRLEFLLPLVVYHRWKWLLTLMLMVLWMYLPETKEQAENNKVSHCFVKFWIYSYMWNTFSFSECSIVMLEGCSLVSCTDGEASCLQLSSSHLEDWAKMKLKTWWERQRNMLMLTDNGR